MIFSFIDYGTQDFVRDHDGSSLKVELNSWADAEDFIMDGRLDEYGWTNKGTRKITWDDEDDEDE